MKDLTFYDAAYPLADPPYTDGFCFYLGGDTPHIWTGTEVAAQKARYRLPVFVRSNPPGPGAGADVAAAVAALKVLGAPKGTLVAWDMETAADAPYIQAVYDGLKDAGYTLIVYGSESAVLGNANPDGLYWGAEWTNVPHFAWRNAMTQYVSLAAYDESLAKPALPFWDTRPGPKPPAPSWPLVPVTLKMPTLKQGDADHAGAHYSVHILQALLAEIGAINDIAWAKGLTGDGVFGAKTKAALEGVQAHYRVKVDGICGSQSWSVLMTGAA